MLGSKVLSIEIGSKNIRILEGHTHGKAVQVTGAAMLPTPQGSFSDGRILGIDELRSCILQAITNAKLSSRGAVFTINSSSLITRELVVPQVKEQELDIIVKVEAEQYFPVLLDDYTLDYKILERFTDDGVNKVRVLAAALPRKLVEACLQLALDMKLKPLAMDVSSNSVSKLFSHEVQINGESCGKGNTVAVIDIGHSFININIVSNGAILFNRMLPGGSGDIDTQVANSFNISLGEAEARIISEADLASDSSLDSRVMFNSAIKSVVDLWLEQIQKVFQYHIRKSAGNTINAIYLYGGGAGLNGLPHYIESMLNIKTSVIESISSVKLSRSSPDLPLRFLLNASGAILRG